MRLFRSKIWHKIGGRSNGGKFNQVLRSRQVVHATHLEKMEDKNDINWSNIVQQKDYICEGPLQ